MSTGLRSVFDKSTIHGTNPTPSPPQTLTTRHVYNLPSLAMTVMCDMTQCHGLAASFPSIQHILDRWVAVIRCLQVVDDFKGGPPHHYGSFLEGIDLGKGNNDDNGLSSILCSHPENDRDVTDRVQEYTLQDASFMRQSWCSFLNA